MNVKIPLFVLWCAALVGNVVFYGLYIDSSSIGRGWLYGGIASSVITVAGAIWYFSTGSGGKTK